MGPVVLVAGTNGKTTTARLLARVVDRALGTPLVNASGANLRQSIASTILLSPTARREGATPAVFEVDELALPGIVADVAPAAIVLTNLFRDQLDRYGEVQVIVDRWRVMLRDLAGRTILVYCADDPRLATLATEAGIRSVTFGLAWPASQSQPPLEVADSTADPVSCPRCGRPLAFDRRSIGHLGRFSCPDRHVGWSRPDVEFEIRDVDGTGCVRLASEREEASFAFGLTGLSFGYDAAAASAAGVALGLPLGVAARALADASPAFGRSEDIDVEGRSVVLSLAKNPASLSEAAALAGRRRPAAVVLALNDAHADGRDVSWIWDADIAPLLGAPTVVLAGARARDLALRAKYDARSGGSSGPLIVDSLEDALARGLGAVGVGEVVLVVATYTALLAIRRRLVELGLATAAPA